MGVHVGGPALLVDHMETATPVARPHPLSLSPLTGGDGPEGPGVWGFASEGSKKEQRRSAAERKAKQSTHQAPEARHRTHSPAQRTRPPQAQRRESQRHGAEAKRSGRATASAPRSGR
ncbi:hypothetical protein HOK021_17990 [Streptomyces hygroscopicus]|nr:hypothetical protein HOK021_17990 [Streptomyces hygroscopicus]